jgi:Mce-associated membrane protein
MRTDTEEVTTTPARDDKDTDITASIKRAETAVAEESGDSETADESITDDDKDTDIAESVERAETAVAKESGDSKTADESITDDAPHKSTKKSRRVSVSVRALVVSAVVVSLIAAVGVMTWLYIGAKANLDDQARQANDTKHAEQIALDYAVNAAIMDYKDLGPWKQNLVKGTTPELKDKLTKAATGMEQILLPLQWSSAAHPLAAKVRSHNNGVYVVDTFVSVMTKTVQAGDSLQSTATYSITIDSNNAWQISDVGGIAAMVADK